MGKLGEGGGGKGKEIKCEEGQGHGEEERMKGEMAGMGASIWRMVWKPSSYVEPCWILRIPSSGGHGVSSRCLLQPGKASSAGNWMYSIELLAKQIPCKIPNNPCCC